jgi:superfamily I DNA/RNA helicase
MEDNPRVAFAGPAGTGKTLLAIEAARRGRAAGRRVLLLCYNNLLGRWLEDQTGRLRPEVQAGTFHRHILRVAGVRPPESASNHFWETELPAKATDKLLEDPAGRFLFDELIIDEAQDLLRDDYLDFLDLSLKGGLASGRWRLFGDFEKQAIYSSATVPLGEFLRDRAAFAPTYGLRINCRNTPRIATYVRLLGRLDPDYARVRRPDDGTEPELIYYRDAGDQQSLVVGALERMYAEGFHGHQIMLLSPKADGAVATKLTLAPWKDRIKPFLELEPGFVGYTSIHQFKGLEACAVIVTDVEQISTAEAAALFYVAITRALHRLIILVDHRAKEQVRSALLRLPGAG